MTASVWVMIAVALVAIEILTPGGFFFACLGIGALVAGALAAVAAPAWAQWAAAVVVGVASIYLVRPAARAFFRVPGIASNVDALVGQAAVVTEPIAPLAPGAVKIGGEWWRAEAEEPLAAGAVVTVVGVSGTRVIVRKA